MITFTERLDAAIRVAARAHEQQGQHRKGSDTPYIIHPFGVMLIASQATSDEDTLIACLLHDVLEDVDASLYSEEEMLRDFGENVLGVVKDVTKDAALDDWHASAKSYLDHLEHRASDAAVVVSASDKIHNLTAIITDYKVQGDDLWQIFSTKNPQDQLWFFESILRVVKKRHVHQLLMRQLEGRIVDLRGLLQVRA